MRKHKHYSEFEDSQLKESRIPEGRTLEGAKKRANKLGLRFCIDPERYFDCREIDLLRRHVIPRGREKKQCINYCRWHRIFWVDGKRTTNRIPWKFEGSLNKR